MGRSFADATRRGSRSVGTTIQGISSPVNAKLIRLLGSLPYKRGELPGILDVELAARAIRDLGEEAGRMVLTDPDRFTPDRYERFVQSVMTLLRPA